MNGYEKQQQQQLREIFRTFLLVALVSVFLILFCVAEKNYEALALIVGVIAIGIFRVGGGAIMYYQEKQRDAP